MSDSQSTPTAKKRSLWWRLYHGETRFDFISRRRTWFTISTVVVLVGLGSLLTRGLHLGIDFEGGVVWEVPANGVSVSEARDAIEPLGLGEATVQTLDSDDGQLIRIKSEALDQEDTDKVTAALADLTGSPGDQINLNEVGATWGRQISEKAVRALIVFLVLVTIYIAIRFESKMAIPTLVALIHDVLFTIGVYSLTQFEVTPATVIAILTILGFSIYDGIVVFDKVDENTRMVSSTGGMSYGAMVNLSLNQTLMRSLNTSLTALLPVGSLLIVGAWIMGATALQEFALALLVGLFSGAYSSIFIASPLLAVLKEREPRYRDIKRRIDAKGGDSAAMPVGAGGRTKATAAAEAKETAGNGEERVVTATGRVIPPRPRKKTKGRRN